MTRLLKSRKDYGTVPNVKRDMSTKCNMWFWTGFFFLKKGIIRTSGDTKISLHNSNLTALLSWCGRIWCTGKPPAGRTELQKCPGWRNTTSEPYFQNALGQKSIHATFLWVWKHFKIKSKMTKMIMIYYSFIPKPSPYNDTPREGTKSYGGAAETSAGWGEHFLPYPASPRRKTPQPGKLQSQAF